MSRTFTDPLLIKKPITTTAIAAIERKFKELEAKVLADITEEIGAWMLTQGFDPEKRCFLVLPQARRSELPRWPAFVRFSPYITTPILMRDTLGGHVTKALDQMKRESIAGLKPCTVYRGYATAIQTRAGTQVVLMGADQDTLIRIAGQLSPKTVLDPKLIMPAVIAHDQYVNELEKDL